MLISAQIMHFLLKTHMHMCYKRWVHNLDTGSKLQETNFTMKIGGRLGQESTPKILWPLFIIATIDVGNFK